MLKNKRGIDFFEERAVPLMNLEDKMTSILGFGVPGNYIDFISKHKVGFTEIKIDGFGGSKNREYAHPIVIKDKKSNEILSGFTFFMDDVKIIEDARSMQMEMLALYGLQDLLGIGGNEAPQGGIYIGFGKENWGVIYAIYWDMPVDTPIANINNIPIECRNFIRKIANDFDDLIDSICYNTDEVVYYLGG